MPKPRYEMFPADFVEVKHERRRSVYKFVFEVDEENAEESLSILGGLPKEGESRPCIIVRPAQAASMADAVQAILQLSKPIKTTGEDDGQNHKHNRAE